MLAGVVKNLKKLNGDSNFSYPIELDKPFKEPDIKTALRKLREIEAEIEREQALLEHRLQEQPNFRWYRFADKWLPIDAKEMVFARINDYQQEIEEALEKGDVEKAKARAKVGNVVIFWDLIKLFLSEINPLNKLLK